MKVKNCIHYNCHANQDGCSIIIIAIYGNLCWKKKEKNYQAGGRGRASASICLNKPPSDSLKKDFMVMASLCR